MWEDLWRNDILPVSHRLGEWNEGLYLGDWRARARERQGLVATS